MNLRKWSICACSLLLLALAVSGHREISAAVLSAGRRCVMIIIPSLYLFSVLSALLVRSGILDMLALPIDRLSRRLFRMDGALLVTLLFSQIAGYPVGAQLLQEMHRKSEIDVKPLLCVCFGCGPAFLLGTVFAVFHAAPELALLMLLSMALPNLLAALLIARRSGLTGKNGAIRQLSLTPETMTASVESGASAMLKICSMILLFSAGMAMLSTGMRSLAEYLLPAGIQNAPLLRSTAASILEISNITEFLQNGGSLPAAAALLSFGGICVHLQNAAIYGGSFPWRQFLLVRMLCALCAGSLCRAGLAILYHAQLQPVFLTQPQYTPALQTERVLPVLCLVIMSVMLLRRQEALRI